MPFHPRATFAGNSSPFKLHWVLAAAQHETITRAGPCGKRGEAVRPRPSLVTSHQTCRPGGRRQQCLGGPERAASTVTFVFPVEEHLSAPPGSAPGGALRWRDRRGAELSGERADRRYEMAQWTSSSTGRKLAGLLWGAARDEGGTLVGVGFERTRRSAQGAGRRCGGQITSLREIAGRAMDMNDALIAVRGRHLHAAPFRAAGERLFAETLARYERATTRWSGGKVSVGPRPGLGES